MERLPFVPLCAVALALTGSLIAMLTRTSQQEAQTAQEAQTTLAGLDESVEESHGKRHCTLISAPSEADITVQAHSAAPDDLMFPAQINHISVPDTPLPEAVHAVTAHDFSTLKACYPRLFAGG